ncbi:MAG TPA: SDR family NAD(P)-dependent oxidoreductase [Mycobacteriales bacterium]|jgi:NAD(P)-dependent dehydrogenase (short-subunit alcohol dehydrogenase family)|nr:SDR family NAD(P)-dependent oxidoreductase [Mycobacteriales bacterium]
MTWGAKTDANDVVDGIDLSGKVALITGASGGIGLETARAFLRAGAQVVLANRNPDKSQAALADLRADLPAAKVEAGALELDSLASVRAFAAWYSEKYSRLDLLVNNAGVMATPMDRTADGFEIQFGINHLGHYLLTNLLLPLVTAPARIVNLTSDGHALSDVKWDDPNWETLEYVPWQAYGQSKTANVLFTTELERRLGNKGVHAYAVHPGVVGTDLFRYLSDQDKSWLDKRLAENKLDYKTPQQGAATTVWAATAPELETQGGIYAEDCHVSDRWKAYAHDPAAAKRLWALSEQMVGQTFPEA